MNRPIRQNVLLAAFVFFIACATGQSATPAADAAINWTDIRIVPGSGISRDTIQAIIRARGGKDAEDVFRDGDIRIRKERKDSSLYPPGAAVEFWYQDTHGTWKPRRTA